MTRREHIEKIIIGTLLESNEERNYYDECRMLTPDMFLDEVNRRLFAVIHDMNAKGERCTGPCTIFSTRFEEVRDIYLDMVDLCTEFSFIHLKTRYNELRFIASCIDGREYRQTDVQFEDYVSEFLKDVYYETRKTS